MQGILIFQSLEEALAKGFEVFDLTADGYVVRKVTEQGYALALVRPSMN